MRWLVCLILAASSVPAVTIQTDPIPSGMLRLRVFGSAILSPADNFQTMHSGFLLVPGEGLYAYGTPLTNAGAGEAEQVSVWRLDDTVGAASGALLDVDVWHTPVLDGGDSLVNPLIPDTLFNVRSDALFDWADSCLCAYTSDPFMFLDLDSVKTFLVRATMACYLPTGRTQNVNLVYSVRWDGGAGLDTALLINGYYNTGSELEPEHNSLSLYAPSVVAEPGLYRIFTVEDTIGARSLALWESPTLGPLSAAPAAWVSHRKLLGGPATAHHNLALVPWTLPDGCQHWHTTIHSPSNGRYEGFATGSLPDNQPVYFGWSDDLENWTTYPQPIIPAAGHRPGNPIIDSTVYTVRPYILSNDTVPHYRLVISGARDTLDTYDWYSTVVDMLLLPPQPPSPPLALAPIDSVCPLVDLTPAFVWSASSDPDPGETVAYRLHLDTLASMATAWVSPPTGDTSITIDDFLALARSYWWRVTAEDSGGLTSESAPVMIRTAIPGDIDGGGGVAVSDLTLLVAYLFRGGSLPCAPELADIDGDCGVSISDLTYLVGSLFRGGPAPMMWCVGSAVSIPRGISPRGHATGRFAR